MILGYFESFDDLLEKHSEGTPLSGCFWCFDNAILIKNSQWKDT